MNDVERLLEDLIVARAARERANQLHAREHAPQFNLCDILWPGETALTRAFRWMLDEEGSHGQCSDFRDAFFKCVLTDARFTGDWSRAIVREEVVTRAGDGRIDLLLERRDGFSVAIENKPWAGWQERQLWRYWNHLADHDPHRCVVALVGGVKNAQREVDMHLAADGSDCGKDVVALTYHPVVEWIDYCADLARPYHVRFFLFDLANYCRRTILPEGLPMDEAHDVVEAAFSRGVASVKAAYAVASALPEIGRKLTIRFKDEIASAVSIRGWQADIIRVAGIERVLLTKDAWRVTFAIGDPASLPWVGIFEKHASGHNLSLLKGEPESKTWPWWRYLKHFELPASFFGPDRISAMYESDREAVAGCLCKIADDVAKALGGQPRLTNATEPGPIDQSGPSPEAPNPVSGTHA